MYAESAVVVRQTNPGILLDAPISLVVQHPFVLVVDPKLPAQNIRDLIALDIDPLLEVPDIVLGWTLFRRFWRQGFATEAACAALCEAKKPGYLLQVRAQRVLLLGESQKALPEGELCSGIQRTGLGWGVDSSDMNDFMGAMVKLRGGPGGTLETMVENLTAVFVEAPEAAR